MNASFLILSLYIELVFLYVYCCYLCIKMLKQLIEDPTDHDGWEVVNWILYKSQTLKESMSTQSCAV